MTTGIDGQQQAAAESQTVTVNVNGRDYDVDGSRPLLHALRTRIGALSVKQGCDTGSCGACTVIIDGKATKTCSRPAKAFAGKKIVTTEGLTDREKAIYCYAFGQAGAVQCGFCTPGLVMATKALLDKNPAPTQQEIIKAIQFNICRCTGYQMVEKAIATAAPLAADDSLPIPERSDERWTVGDDSIRPDSDEKVLGTGKFADDVSLPGMVYAKALRSPSPRGLVRGIDLTRARAHPNCLEILLAEDVPNNIHGHITPDWDVLIPVGHETRYVGDAIALVASDDQDKLDEILDLIDLDYEELEPVTSPQQALLPDAPLIHENGNVYDIEHVNRGNADQAIREAAHSVTKKFHTPYQEHGFMEPECAVAEPTADGGLQMYTSSQSVFDEQREVSRMLKLPPEKVRSMATLVGGGFGGKEDMSVQHHAALMAWKLQKPVKVKFNRTESLNYHVKRHPMDIEFTVACDENARITAIKVVILADSGAYASLSGPVLQRSCTHAGGPYITDNFEVLGLALYTNNCVTGAFRGFGALQSQTCLETCTNILAEEIGMDAWEFKYKNVVRPGDCLPNGQIADESTGMVECLDAIKPIYDAHPGGGLAVAFKNTGVGVGLTDTGRCTLSVEDGRVHIRTSASCMGQGVAQVVEHMLMQTVDLRPSQVVYELPDTARTPDSGTSTGSRQTLFTGEATRQAAVKLNDALQEAGGDLQALEGREFFAEFSPETDPVSTTKKHPYSHVGYGYGLQYVTLNEAGKVDHVWAIYDVGTVVNQQAATGQIEGGVVMGLGYGLTEDFVVEGGYPKTRFSKIGLLRADQVPPIDVTFVTGPGTLEYAYGAKGMGEICLIPTAAACNAAYHYRGDPWRTSFPMKGTPYKK
ncbi:selenium-dependent xanthine dehydrogenase [Propionibacterium sp.]|uniref:selenium-dependent xanthine dehydrogenase n=1 Tax=Propionibacterium sp. TaxID=1977903 RepID=UPI0039EA814E